MCVCGDAGQSVKFTIIPTNLGRIPLTVTAQTSTAKLCPNTSLVAADAVTRKLLVQVYFSIFKSYHTTPHHTRPHYTTPHHTIPYHTIPYHTMHACNTIYIYIYIYMCVCVCAIYILAQTQVSVLPLISKYRQAG